MSIASTLIEQLDATWLMTQELIDQCPEDQWRRGESSYFTPACQLYHLLDCAQCLVGNPPRPAPTPKPFGPHWDGPLERIPSRQQLRDLLDKVRGDAAAWVGSLSDTEIISNHPSLANIPRKMPLNQVIYAIRHNQYHLAVVNAEMRHRKLPRMQWR